MVKKLDYIKVKQNIEGLGYILVSDNYKSSKNKLTIKDFEEYYYLILYSNLIKFKNVKKFHKSNPYTIHNIKLWCIINNKPLELISDKYKNANEYLEWKCLKEGCREIFKATWNSIQQGHGCGYCAGMQTSTSNCLATKNPELAAEWHPTLNGDLTPFDVTFSNSKKMIWWQCKNNSKHQWRTTVYNRNEHKSNCPYCAGQLPSEEYNLLVCNPELCKEWNYNLNKKKPEEYTPGSGKIVWWICRECGHEWQTAINCRNGSSTGCPECNKSKGEKRISKWLNLNNICFEPQKEFNGLVGLGNGNLSYDFYLLDYNLLIEYQGEKHEKFIPGIHKSKKDFEKQLEHDKRKRKYAKNNNINLLEIWYWDYDNIEGILNIYLKKERDLVFKLDR